MLMGNMPVPLPRVGGKKRLLPQIVPWLAKKLDGEKEYVEPFLGGGSVALALLDQELVEPRKMLLADGDLRVVMFWQAVQTRTADMVRLVRTGHYCTKRWHRGMELLAGDVSKCDPVEVGFHLWHNARWGYSAMAKRSMPTFNKRRFSPMWADCFEWAAGLLEGVRIEDWHWSRTLDDCPNGVGFIDPPYWGTVGKGKHYYHVNMEQHEHYWLQEELAARESPWMLSYDDPMWMGRDMAKVEGVERRVVWVRGGLGTEKRRRKEVIYTRG